MTKLLPGLTFSLRRAIGWTRFQSNLSRKIGIPLSRGGREKKVGSLLLRLLFGRKH